MEISTKRCLPSLQYNKIRWHSACGAQTFQKKYPFLPLNRQSVKVMPHTLGSPSPDGYHGAWLPFLGLPPRKLSAAEVHRETSGDAT